MNENFDAFKPENYNLLYVGELISLFEEKAADGEIISVCRFLRL